MTSRDAPTRHTVLFPYVGGEGIVGGSHISSLKLVSALREHPRYRPLIALHRGDGPLSRLVETMGLGYELLAAGGIIEQDRWQTSTPPRFRRARESLSYLGRTLPDMVRFLKAWDVRIVHTNDGRMHANWAPATTLARRAHVWHHRAEPTAKGVNLLAPLLADRIVSVSRFSKPSRPVRDVGRKLRVIYSPFDPPGPVDRHEARSRLLEELGCGPDVRLISVVGTLVARKRPLDFVEVVAHLRDTCPGPPVMGLVFGTPLATGPRLDAAVLDHAARLGVRDRIRLMGFRSPIEPYIAALDVLLVPAMDEPFGRSLIEAMQIGTPVVAYDHGGNTEAIAQGETGYLVAPGRPEAFVAPIRRLLEDEVEWHRIADAARRYALASFSTARHVDEVVRLYDELTGG